MNSLKALAGDLWRRSPIIAGTLVASTTIVVLAAAALALDGYPRLAAWLVVASLAAGLGGVACAGQRRPSVLALIAASIAVRWVAGAALLVVLTPRGHFGYFNPDEIIFNRAAVVLSSGGAIPASLAFVVDPFTRLVGLAYLVGGADPLAGKAVLSICGVLMVGIVFRVVRAVDGTDRTALIAAGAMALWPTTLGWSVVLLKDATLGLAMALGIMGLVEIRRGRVALGGFLVLAATSWQVSIRVSEAAVFLGAEAVVGAVWFASRSRATLATTMAGILAVGTIIAIVPDLRERVDRAPGELRTRRVENSRGNTSIDAQRSFGIAVPALRSTWPKEIERLPSAAATVWLRPAPWEALGADNNSQRLGAAMAPLWYAALILAFVGVIDLTRRRQPWWAWILAAPVLGSIGPLAAGEGNLGTAVRHRDSVTALLLSLATIGGVAMVHAVRSSRAVQPAEPAGAD